MLSAHRNTVIVASVLLLHVAALWALQSGLLRQAVERVVPVEVLSEFTAPPSPPPAPPAPLPPPPRSLTPPSQPAPPAAPALPHPAETTPAKAVAAPVTDAPSTAPPPPSATTAPPAPSTSRASMKVELPSSDAQYLRNPKPVYPALSKRLGEQGKVVIRVFIAADGSAQQAEIQQSSGFERLDQAALQTVLGWRFVPGKRGGVAEAMWFSIPLNFILE